MKFARRDYKNVEKIASVIAIISHSRESLKYINNGPSDDDK